MRSMQRDDVRAGVRVQLVAEIPFASRLTTSLKPGARGVVVNRRGSGNAATVEHSVDGMAVGVRWEGDEYAIWTPLWCLAVDVPVRLAPRQQLLDQVVFDTAYLRALGVRPAAKALLRNWLRQGGVPMEARLRIEAAVRRGYTLDMAV